MPFNFKEEEPLSNERSRLKTNNAMGFIFLKTNKVRQTLSCYAKPGCTIADIGCAYGLDSYRLIKGGAKVTAIDLDAYHLQTLVNQLAPEEQKNITLKQGHFPYEIKLEESAYDVILLSRILIFLHPNELDKAFQQIFKALKKGGKVLIVNATPLNQGWDSVQEKYKDHLLRTPSLPFFIDNVAQDLPHLTSYFPSHLLLFDQSSLTALLQTHTFEILDCDYEEDDGTREVYAIAVRP